MLKDEITLQQICTVTIKNKDGSIESLQVFTNDIVTTQGKNRAASHLANSAPGKTWFTHLALGTNDDAESTEDVALGAEFYRVALDGVAGDDAVPNSVFAVGETVFGHAVIQADTIAAGTITIKELGLLDALVGGNLQCRQVPDTTLTFSGTQKMDILWGVIVN